METWQLLLNSQCLPGVSLMLPCWIYVWNRTNLPMNQFALCVSPAGFPSPLDAESCKPSTEHYTELHHANNVNIRKHVGLNHSENWGCRYNSNEVWAREDIEERASRARAAAAVKACDLLNLAGGCCGSVLVPADSLVRKQQRNYCPCRKLSQVLYEAFSQVCVCWFLLCGLFTFPQRSLINEHGFGARV